ncbi:MAG: hypothetical protein EP315_01715 [Gammaproteobacteria bacterium]|nr:MAG: hypothetical protein EP315_01715 [Gammaproteobacteria bacterium]
MRLRLGKAIATILLLLLAISGAGLYWLGATEAGLHWVVQRAMTYTSGKLHVQKLEGRLFDVVYATQIEYEQDNNRIRADKIELSWRMTQLLQVSLAIEHLHVQGLNIQLADTAGNDQPLKLPDIYLPWRIKLHDVLIQELNIQQNGQQFHIQQIELDAETVFNQINIDKLNLDSDAVNVQLTGNIKPSRHYPHDLTIQWQSRLPSSADISGTGTISGDINRLGIQQTISGPLQASLNVEIHNPLQQLQWQASTDIHSFNIQTVESSWPAIKGHAKLQAEGDASTAQIRGTVDGTLPDNSPFDARFNLATTPEKSVTIEKLYVHSSLTRTEINAQGQWTPGDNGGNLSAQLDWLNLRWPLQDTPWFNSAQGNGRIEGTVNDYRFTLTTDRPWPQAPPSTWYADAEGNLDGIHFHRLRIQALDGETLIKGQLNWHPELSWDATANSSDLNPVSYLPQWPGKLNASFSSQGKLFNGQLSTRVDIRKLSGRLRGYPVSLNSQLEWKNHSLHIKQLKARSGTSQINADGYLGDNYNLNWSIAASNLAELYPEAQGSLQASGRLSGGRSAPVIQTSFTGKALSLPQYSIASINGKLTLDVYQWQQIAASISAEDINLKGHRLHILNLSADDQHIKLDSISDGLTTSIALAGKADPQGWQGTLNQASFISEQFGHWQLTQPVAIAIQDKHVSADKACWRNQHTASVCATQQQTAEHWQTQLHAEQLPLQLIRPWLLKDIDIDAVANLDADLQIKPAAQVLGHIRVDLPGGTISYSGLQDDAEHWSYRSGKIDLELNLQGIQLSSELDINDTDRLQASFNLPDARLMTLDLPNQSLQGKALLSMKDLSIFEALLPEVADFKGEIAVTFTALGTLAQPQIQGQFQLDNSSLSIPRLGLSLKQIRLQGQSNSLQNFDFTLKAHSGDGELNIQGKAGLDKNTGWSGTMTVAGDNFEVSNILEARLAVTPKLNIELQKNAININGSIHIPHAKLQPRDITTAARVSSDVVIVQSEQTTIEKWLISTRIRLTLGDRVNFYGFGFEGRFGGNLLIEDIPGQLTRATGEINIPEGRYTAYGQRLEVEQGRLLYTGGPISNPGLDIRAIRKVNNVTAGLKVRGSLDQPQIELFSIPAMGETDALSYLILGRPIETASENEGSMMAKAALALSLSGGDKLARVLGDRFGLDEMRIESSDDGDQASLVIGRYLSPKLYISYGVGLIETFNTFYVRYQISDKWQLKGESGEQQGADILYTIER